MPTAHHHSSTRQLVNSSVALLLASGFCLLASPARADQLPDGYQFRRPLNFKQLVSDAPGPNAAVAEFYANGTQKPDASDFRVTTADRTLVPIRVLQFSPKDDFVRIAFETHSDGPYYVWWDNPKADAPAKPLDIKRGIYTEIFRIPPAARNRDISSLDKLFDRATPLGATFVPEIFLGYNPLGEEWEIMFRYTGQFKIDKPVTVDFAFSAQDSGSFFIDGKPIAHTFRNKFQNKVRDPKPVELTAGWHTIEVTQANIDGGQAGVVVAWRHPDQRNYVPIAPLFFAPIAPATAGLLEKIGGGTGGGGGGYTADFDIAPEAETFSPPDMYFQRYTFDADYPATFSPTLTWDFGDGQTATVQGATFKRINHIYLAPGVYTVTLKVDQNAGAAVNSFTASRRITIKDRMYSRFPHPPEDPAKVANPLLKSYDLKKLSADQAFRGYLYFKDKNDVNALLGWGKAWLSAKDAGTSEKNLFDETFDFAQLLKSQGDYTNAADAYLLASQKTVSLAARLNLMRYRVMTLCDYCDGAAAALKEAQDWQKKINETDKQQLLVVQAAILYAAIAKGDAASVKLAQATLEQIKANRPTGGAGYNDAQIRQGVLARNIENYIRTREFDTALKLIDEWELEFPEALWDGFTRTLRVKLASAENRPLVAANIALQHAKANPTGVYADELLYRASQNFKLAKQPTQAQAALDLLNSKYPESPYARGESKEK